MNEIELIYKPHTSFCLGEVEEKVIEILEEKEVTATSISSSSTCSSNCSSNCSTNKQTLSLDSSNMSSCCSSYHSILTCPTHDTDCSSESSVSENDYQYTKWKSKLMNRSPSPLRHDSKNINTSDDDNNKSISHNGSHSSSSSSSVIQAQIFRKHTSLNASDENNTSYIHHNVNSPFHSTLSTHVDLSVITDTSSFQNDENIETPKIKNHISNKSLTSTLQTPCTSNVLQHDIDNSLSLSSLEVKETTIIPSPIHTVCTESTSLMSSPMSSCTYISTGNHQSFKQQNPSAPLLRPSGVVRAPSSSSVRFMDVKPSTEDNLAQAKALLDYARDLRKKLQKQ